MKYHEKKYRGIYNNTEAKIVIHRFILQIMLLAQSYLLWHNDILYF